MWNVEYERMEARGGIEPPIKVLQTYALPLGDRADGVCNYQIITLGLQADISKIHMELICEAAGCPSQKSWEGETDEGE
jgi:hypothetical protein